ncbi:serine/threonine protein kinase [Brasilonema octagenarum UFV-E1]|uniref:non-specific serine/threonine protein kinase n=1 Tax=Brasilonema sennae CENA114 TaxID=415709 RepID=A0A856MFA7_9CYAN|nr:serine/threonine-protein kinase [Brasilonema sennae]QDL08950.1 serine/threonine protein kinase [Brasilonema sennae CENA114]QDL15305.1 serine/threonine protein kinase [Brasilonema octagenarum UFV-E1]
MVGQTICGRYRIIRQIGKGGFGVTFLAEDTQRPGNPQCVVKQFKPQSDDAYTLHHAKRFFDQEAQMLEVLGNYDQIPRLLAHCEQNQEFYIVQEYIKGQDLNQEVFSGRQLSEPEVIKLLKEILEVLAFVHQQGVIHRDLKPSNIMRRELDGKIVLIDFGAVKQIATQIANAQGHTNFTVAVGTPGYVPSEQAKGKPTLSSDIYAVGVICIQALTGMNSNPRHGGLPTDSKTGEIIWRDRAKVSPKLANIIDKMVRDHFSQRYQSADEALQAVRSLSSKSPPKKVWVGVGIVAALIPLIIWFGYQFWNVKPTKPKPNFSANTYSDYGVEIKYPENWTRQDEPVKFGDEVTKFIPSSDKPSNACPLEIVVNVSELSQGFSLKGYKESVENKIKNIIPDTQIADESTSATTLSNYKAYKLSYRRQEQQCRLKVMEIGTVRGGKAYYVTYTAEVTQYDKYLADVEQMIKSFQILDVKESK